MKLHQTALGTNPRRVMIYMAEKGIDLPRQEVDMQAGEHKSPAFLALNPAGKVPVLELDDGSTISESAAIIEYLEELHPEPPMIGTDPAERARVRALERIASDLVGRCGLWFLHTQPFFAGRVAQNPAAGAAARAYAQDLIDTLETYLGDRPFLAGDAPTVADCTLFALFQAARGRFGVVLDEERPRLAAWYDRFARRPSAGG